MFDATFWKVVGLALTAALGVIGTVTDTKEKTDTGYKVRKVGWVVVAAIVLSSLVGGLAQYYDERAKNASEAMMASKQEAQLQKLGAITADVQNVRYPLTTLGIAGVLNIPANDPVLQRLRAAHPQFMADTPPASGESRMSEEDELKYSAELIRGMSVRVRVGGPNVDLFNEVIIHPPVRATCEERDALCADVSYDDAAHMVVVQMLRPIPFNRAILDSLVAFGGRKVAVWASLGPSDGETRAVELSGVAIMDTTNHRYLVIDQWQNSKHSHNQIFVDTVLPRDLVGRSDGIRWRNEDDGTY